MLVIELDGDSHYQEGADEYDNLRTEFMKAEGIKVIRFTNNDIYENMIQVLQTIKNVVEKI